MTYEAEQPQCSMCGRGPGDYPEAMDRKESIEIMVNGVNPLFFGKGGAENARMVAEDMFDALAAARVGTEKP